MDEEKKVNSSAFQEWLRRNFSFDESKNDLQQRSAIYLTSGLLTFIAASTLYSLNYCPQYNTNTEYLTHFTNISLAMMTFSALFLSTAWTLHATYQSSIKWYSVYHRFHSIGLERINLDRKGRNEDRDDEWRNRVANCRERIVLSGITQSGWFSEQKWNSFESIFRTAAKRGVQIFVFLSNPIGPESCIRDFEEEMKLGESSRKSDVTSRVIDVLHTFSKILVDPDFRVVRNIYSESHPFRIFIYDGTVLPINKFDTFVSMHHYLPGKENRECPELEFSIQKPIDYVIEESLRQLLSRAKAMDTHMHRLKVSTDQEEPNLKSLWAIEVRSPKSLEFLIREISTKSSDIIEGREAVVLSGRKLYSEMWELDEAFANAANSGQLCESEPGEAIAGTDGAVQSEDESDL